MQPDSHLICSFGQHNPRSTSLNPLATVCLHAAPRSNLVTSSAQHPLPWIVLYPSPTKIIRTHEYASSCEHFGASFDIFWVFFVAVWLAAHPGAQISLTVAVIVLFVHLELSTPSTPRAHSHVYSELTTNVGHEQGVVALRAPLGQLSSAVSKH
jgi:hypothetical protein